MKLAASLKYSGISSDSEFSLFLSEQLGGIGSASIGCVGVRCAVSDEVCEFEISRFETWSETNDDPNKTGCRLGVGSGAWKYIFLIVRNRVKTFKDFEHN